MTLAHDPATLAFYAAEAAAYALKSDRNGPSDSLRRFLGRLAPGAHILDLGCGSGRDTGAMIAAGFKVTAQDGCPELALETERRIGQAVRIQLFEELSEIDAFDAVWANASLLHVPSPALANIFGRIHRALRHTGLLYCSLKSGTTDGRDGFGRYYNYLSATELRAYLSPPNLQIIELHEGKGYGYDGMETGWIEALARRPIRG